MIEHDARASGEISPVVSDRVAGIIINGTVATLATVSVIGLEVPELVAENAYELESQEVQEANEVLMEFDSNAIDLEVGSVAVVQASVIVGVFVSTYMASAFFRSMNSMRRKRWSSRS